MEEQLTDDQTLEDTAIRMGEFRQGMADLIQKTNIHPEVAMNSNNVVGITLIDDKFSRGEEFDEQARQLALKKFQDLKDAEPLPEPTPEEEAFLKELLEGEGDVIPPAHVEDTDEATEA